MADVAGRGRKPGVHPQVRQAERDRLCLADYFRPIESGEYDVAAFQVVTAGQAAGEHSEALRVAGEYTTSYQVHGLASQVAEALAEYVHGVVRRELALESSQGNRYSWGYFACPDVSAQGKLFKLLPITEATGVTLTESFQWMPEQSTAAIVIHHPEAKYYVVREDAAAAGRA